MTAPWSPADDAFAVFLLRLQTDPARVRRLVRLGGVHVPRRVRQERLYQAETELLRRKLRARHLTPLHRAAPTERKAS